MLSAAQMNSSLRAIDAHDRYASGSVAFNDGARGVVVNDGKANVSVWGDNITDARIVTKDGGGCQFIRPPNVDETLGVMYARDILMVDGEGKNLTVQDLLNDLEERSKYMGYTSVNVNADADQRVVVRCQTSWVPIKKGTTTTEILPEHYSYQTHSRTNPRNMIMLGTPNGVFAHNDDVGGNKLFAHTVTESGEVKNHWFEAEANKDCMVGHAATLEEPEEGQWSKKARAVEMGIRGMGHRTNCFVIVSVPNTQKVEQRTRSMGGDVSEEVEGAAYRSLRVVTGNSYAARVSMAEESVGTCAPNATDILRQKGAPIMVTILTYNTIEVPDDFEGNPNTLKVATTDVALGVADLDRQYELIKKNGGSVCKLSELPAMLHVLNGGHMAQIARKIKEDPYPSSKPDPMTPSSSALAAFV